MYKNIVTQTLRKPLLKSLELSVDVLRLDLFHPVISGNKWFKLKYHLSEALHQGKKCIVTFGGAYSNHLVATATTCKEFNLKSIAIIRGEKTFPVNDSIKQMEEAGMDCIYVDRKAYRDKDTIIKNFLNSHPEYYYVPEGGQSAEGIRGAEEILSYAGKDYSHIICPVGTGTTLAGLVNATGERQQVIGICALKIPGTHSNELNEFINSATINKNYTLFYEYHFGGYAKTNDELFTFMNNLFKEEEIPTDFVYTGKMFYGTFDLMKKKYFAPGSKLLLIHTGGLQGNRSLKRGTLVF